MGRFTIPRRRRTVPVQVNIRMSDASLRELDRLSEGLGLNSRAAVIRTALDFFADRSPAAKTALRRKLPAQRVEIPSGGSSGDADAPGDAPEYP